MPVLGSGGVLELRRELPPAVVVSPGAVRDHVDSLDISADGYWTGDKVFVWGPRGVPFDLNEDGRPDLIGGFGMFFGSRLALFGARAARLQSGNSPWFGPEPPFQTPEDDSRLDRAELFVYRDSLDRLSFYRTLDGALDGESAGRLRIYPVDFRLMLLAPAGASGYQDRLAPTYPELAAYQFPENVTDLPLEKVSTAAEPEPTGDASDRSWVFVAEMDEWNLELSAKEVDTTGLGEGFGESTRALITGGGSMNFYLNRYQRGNEVDATFIARLLTLLEQGCNAEANFIIASKKPRYELQAEQVRLPRNDVSYKATLILTANAVDTRADDLIRGSARFVTVGRIKLSIS